MLNAWAKKIYENAANTALCRVFLAQLPPFIVVPAPFNKGKQPLPLLASIRMIGSPGSLIYFTVYLYHQIFTSLNRRK